MATQTSYCKNFKDEPRVTRRIFVQAKKSGEKVVEELERILCTKQFLSESFKDIIKRDTCTENCSLCVFL
jgi:hypothetical protein